MHLLQSQTVSLPPPHRTSNETSTTYGEHDERPDKGYCQKIPQGVCAVAYDRYWFYFSDYFEFDWHEIEVVQDFPKYFTQILFNPHLINMFAAMILFIQFHMQRWWLEADASRRADTVSLLEQQIQIQVFSSQELPFREQVHSSPQMSKSAKQIFNFCDNFDKLAFHYRCPIYGYWRNLFPMILSNTKSNLCGIPRNDMDLIAVRDGCTFTGQIKYCGHSGGLSIINI